jgi:hypothetical protein
MQEDTITQENPYRFTFNYEMLGNRSNFNSIYYSCALQWKITSWIDQEARLKPVYSCIARRYAEGKYDLIYSAKKEFERYMASS